MQECMKFEFYAPESHIEEVKAAVFAAGGGRIGNYDCCCWETKGTGQFRPLEGSSPFIGRKDEIEKVSEYKVEMICEESLMEKILEAFKKSHPYETPAYQCWKVKI